MTEKQHKTRSILKHDKRPLYCMDNKIKNTLVHTGLCLLHNSEIQRHKHRMVCNTSYMQISFNLQSKNSFHINGHVQPSLILRERPVNSPFCHYKDI